MIFHQHFNLQTLNTFRIQVNCRYFTEVHTTDDIREVISLEEFKTIDKLILGGGSNILFTKDYNGLVIKNSIPGITIIKEDNEHVYVKASAGVIWHQFVIWCIDNNLAGIENLSLIPGQVGAAPMQNIGAYGVEIKDVFEALEALNIASGEVHSFNLQDCAFGYRESVFKNKFRNQYIILNVTFRLNKKPVFHINYGDIKNTLEQMQINELSIKAVSDAVIKIRSSKLPDPAVLGNAGSFFKNPVISKEQFDALILQYPLMPNYPQSSHEVKIPAGWLIEQCGWKGKVVGNTGSHKTQALVLVNYGHATGPEIYQLALDIQQSVKEKFGILIQPEVNLV
jgi:UDP-N-acetylmuramate dehydrogenase